MAAIPAATLPAAATAGSSLGSTMRRKTAAVHVEGMGAYNGLKAHNDVAALGVPKGVDQCFAAVVGSLRPSGKKRGGGALAAQCNAAGEIFRIAVIMNGLVLVGVAVGFVLLRVEAAIEESE